MNSYLCHPMNYLLYLDTSAAHSTVLLLDETKVLAERINEHQSNHSQVINQLIEEVLSEAMITLNDVHTVCVLNGPGSYTGLRIALSTAKGICYANDLPLILISKLDLLQYVASIEIPGQAACTIIKARENEYFAAFYSGDGIRLGEPAVMSPEELKVQIGLQGCVLCFEDPTYENQFECFRLVTVQKEALLAICVKYFLERKHADLLSSEPFYYKNVFINKINKL